MRAVPLLAVGAIVGIGIVLGAYLLRGNPDTPAMSRPTATPVPAESGKSADGRHVSDDEAPTKRSGESPPSEDRLSGVSTPPTDEAKPRRNFPEDAEARIWQVLAANQHLKFTSIDRVVCQPTICEIRYSGGPDLSDGATTGYMLDHLGRALPMIKSGTLSSRVELSPGVFSSVITIRSYIGGEQLKDYQIVPH